MPMIIAAVIAATITFSGPVDKMCREKTKHLPLNLEGLSEAQKADALVRNSATTKDYATCLRMELKRQQNVK